MYTRHTAKRELEKGKYPEEIKRKKLVEEERWKTDTNKEPL